MEMRLAIVLGRDGRIAQTTVLADRLPDRSEGHRLLQLIQPELPLLPSRSRRALSGTADCSDDGYDRKTLRAHRSIPPEAFEVLAASLREDMPQQSRSRVAGRLQSP